MNRQLTPKASQERFCLKETQAVSVREIMPAREKKKNARKGKALSSKHVTSDETVSKAIRSSF
jgi:hypothetical protein